MRNAKIVSDTRTENGRLIIAEASLLQTATEQFFYFVCDADKWNESSEEQSVRRTNDLGMRVVHEGVVDMAMRLMVGFHERPVDGIKLLREYHPVKPGLHHAKSAYEVARYLWKKTEQGQNVLEQKEADASAVVRRLDADKRVKELEETLAEKARHWRLAANSRDSLLALRDELEDEIRGLVGKNEQLIKDRDQALAERDNQALIAECHFEMLRMVRLAVNAPLPDDEGKQISMAPAVPVNPHWEPGWSETDRKACMAQGWLLVCLNGDPDNLVIQKYDETEDKYWFETDAEAYEYVRGRADMGCKLAKKAFRLIDEAEGRRAAKEGKVVRDEAGAVKCGGYDGAADDDDPFAE